MDKYFFSNYFMSTVKYPSEIMINIQPYAYYLKTKLLGEPNLLLPGEENIVHFQIYPNGPENLFFDFLKDKFDKEEFDEDDIYG